MMRYASTVLFLLGACVPHLLHASVVISEVAWMGNAENANAEWIELYNNGEGVDLAGWTVSAVDGQPMIQLSGVLSANSYALLERTSDETVPSVSAFLVYTGAMGNAGELLELRDHNGVVVDSVDGRDNWSIGGNNTTKETLQRSGNPPLGAWTTGAPSPKGSAPSPSLGSALSTVVEKSERAGTGTGVIQSAIPVKEEKVKLEPALVLDIGENRTVFVGSEVTFFARGYKESGKEAVVENVVWNFGDGATAKGREVAHRFWYEGEYVVTAVGRRDGFLKDIRDEDSIIVRVVPASVTIEHADSEYVALKNTGSELVDIGGCVLISGTQHFRIPGGTKVLPRATVRFSQKVTAMVVGGAVRLYDDMGVLMGEYDTTPQVLGAVDRASVPRAPTSEVTTTEERADAVEGGARTAKTQPPYRYPEILATANAYESPNTKTEQKEIPLWWWIFGLITAIVTTVIAVLLIRREQKEVLEGFYIEDDNT